MAPCFLLSKVIPLLSFCIFYENLKDSLLTSSAWCVALNLPGWGLVMKWRDLQVAVNFARPEE